MAGDRTNLTKVWNLGRGGGEVSIQYMLSTFDSYVFKVSPRLFGALGCGKQSAQATGPLVNYYNTTAYVILN